MVIKPPISVPHKIEIATGGINRTKNVINKIILVNSILTLILLFLVLYFFGNNFYSLLYLMMTAFSLLASLAVLTDLVRYSAIRFVIFLPSYFMPYNIIILVGSASYYFGTEIRICVLISLFYVLCFMFYVLCFMHDIL